MGNLVATYRVGFDGRVGRWRVHLRRCWSHNAPAENIAELKIFGDKPGIKITLEVSVVYQAKIITWI